MELTIFWSTSLDFLFLWILFLSIIGFTIWVYFFAKWNVLGPKFKAKFNSKKEKKIKDSIVLDDIDKKISSAEQEQQIVQITDQELLKLQNQKDKLLNKQKQLDLIQEQDKLNKQKELDFKKQLKNQKKSKNKINEKDLKNEEKLFIEQEFKSLITIDQFKFDE